MYKIINLKIIQSRTDQINLYIQCVIGILAALKVKLNLMVNIYKTEKVSSVWNCKATRFVYIAKIHCGKMKKINAHALIREFFRHDVIIRSRLYLLQGVYINAYFVSLQQRDCLVFAKFTRHFSASYCRNEEFRRLGTTFNKGFFVLTSTVETVPNKCRETKAIVFNSSSVVNFSGL